MTPAWTSEAPTEAGWYWRRRPDKLNEDGSAKTWLTMVSWVGMRNGELCVDRYMPVSGESMWQWSGPLPEPPPAGE